MNFLNIMLKGKKPDTKQYTLYIFYLRDIQVKLISGVTRVSLEYSVTGRVQLAPFNLGGAFVGVFSLCIYIYVHFHVYYISVTLGNLDNLSKSQFHLL